jgi:hypothetical protein
MENKTGHEKQKIGGEKKIFKQVGDDQRKPP